MNRQIVKRVVLSSAVVGVAAIALVATTQGKLARNDSQGLEARCVSLPCATPTEQAVPDDEHARPGLTPLLLRMLPALRFAPIVPIPLAPPWLQLEMQRVQAVLIG